MERLLVAPSILSADFADMGAAVGRLADWGADWVHCDVMDGVFVPNITFGMPMVAAIRKHTALPLDVHLMIVRPENYVERFIDAGADIVTFHASECACVRETLRRIRERGRKGGLVLNPDVPVSEVELYLDDVDVIMLMGVYPGFGGQKYIPEVSLKIAELARLIGKRDIMIELDGGVTQNNAAEIAGLGARVLVAGSSVFGAADPAAAVAKIGGREPF